MEGNVVILDRGNNTTCSVNLHGATVTSWRVCNKEQLFFGKTAIVDRKEVIRGGIVLNFPKYCEWAFGPQHGFLRFMQWDVEQCPKMLLNGDIEAKFSIESDAFSKSMWNYNFKIIYTVVLSEEQLFCNLEIFNTSDKFTMRFNVLLRTYIQVPDINSCRIYGLKGCQYVHRKHDNDKFIDEEKFLTIDDVMDRIYLNKGSKITVKNLYFDREMQIYHSSPDIVIWNPWMEQEVVDLLPDEYKNFISIETGYVWNNTKILPMHSLDVGHALHLVCNRYCAYDTDDFLEMDDPFYK